MGWFSRAFNTVTDKVKNVMKPVFNKVKKGWNVVGQAAEYTHQHIMPKAKAALTVASFIPAVQEFAIPALAGITAADLALGKGLDLKRKAEGYARNAQQIHKVAGDAVKWVAGDVAKWGDIGLSSLGQQIFH